MPPFLHGFLAHLSDSYSHKGPDEKKINKQVFIHLFQLYMYILVQIKSFAIFGYMQVCGMYIIRAKLFRLLKVPAVVDGIMEVSVLIFHYMYDLKAAQGNVQCSLIKKLRERVREHMMTMMILYEFKLGHNAAETTKNICSMKS